MRIFSNCWEMVKEVEREIFEQGITNHPSTMQDKWVGDDSDYETKELVGFSYALSSYQDMDDMFYFFDDEIKDKGLEYSRQEFSERVLNQPVNPGNSWKVREEFWKPYLDENGKFAYTYNERIWFQLWKVLCNIDTSVGSRQNIISIYNPTIDTDRIGGNIRIPCSLTYQFLPRVFISGEKVMFMIYSMRSCDFFQHFPIDVHLALQMLKYVSARTNHIPGTFIHQIGSLHMYKKQYGKRRIF